MRRDVLPYKAVAGWLALRSLSHYSDSAIAVVVVHLPSEQYFFSQCTELSTWLSTTTVPSDPPPPLGSMELKLVDDIGAREYSLATLPCKYTTNGALL